MIWAFLRPLVWSIAPYGSGTTGFLHGEGFGDGGGYGGNGDGWDYHDSMGRGFGYYNGDGAGYGLGDKNDDMT